jgi:hypothetical protein
VTRAGLVATQQLADLINGGVGQTRSQQRSFSVTVVARDRFGNTSRPTNVQVSILFGPPAATPEPELTPLQALARDIATRLDPQHTTAYFDGYERALRVPSDCGTTAEDANFVANYRQAFETVKARLTASNIDAFYAGVCSAWSSAVADENSKRAAAQAAREAALARNAEAQAIHALGLFGGTIGQGVMLWIVKGAITTFLLASLSLAFLAIESHSRALRAAVQLISERKP